VRKDLGMDVLQLRGRFDPQAVDEEVPGTAVGGKRVRLSPGSVERGHELTPKALALRGVRQQLLQLRDEFGAGAEG
jgi:hypothetical protein